MKFFTVNDLSTSYGKHEILSHLSFETEPSETKVSAEDREVSFWDFSEFPDNLYCLVSWMIFWK